ncbi:unnamed protein product [Moneuplotes crassus]|uniref:Uncharacterized protein n=1 Tax=Euplotes crassus TaxID=5936 RepID=A0AAD1U5T2_EUPCR|nr:unnamed protein product [Moneuplotes crassus]
MSKDNQFTPSHCDIRHKDSLKDPTELVDPDLAEPDLKISSSDNQAQESIPQNESQNSRTKNQIYLRKNTEYGLKNRIQDIPYHLILKEQIIRDDDRDTENSSLWAFLSKIILNNKFEKFFKDEPRRRKTVHPSLNSKINRTTLKMLHKFHLKKIAEAKNKRMPSKRFMFKSLKPKVKSTNVNLLSNTLAMSNNRSNSSLPKQNLLNRIKTEIPSNDLSKLSGRSVKKQKSPTRSKQRSPKRMKNKMAKPSSKKLTIQYPIPQAEESKMNPIRIKLPGTKKPKSRQTKHKCFLSKKTDEHCKMHQQRPWQFSPTRTHFRNPTKVIGKTINRLFPHDPAFTKNKLLGYIKNQVRRTARIKSAKPQRTKSNIRDIRAAVNNISKNHFSNRQNTFDTQDPSLVTNNVEISFSNKQSFSSRNFPDRHHTMVVDKKIPNEHVKTSRKPRKSKLLAKKRVKSGNPSKGRSRCTDKSLKTCLKDENLAKHYLHAKVALNSLSY